MENKIVFAEIESLEKDEVMGMFTYLCEKVLLKAVSDTKRELGIGREHAPNGKHLIELIKKYNLNFTLRIRHEKVISTKEERVEAQNKETPDLNSTMKQPDFLTQMDNQLKEIKNPDLKSVVITPEESQTGTVTQGPLPPSLPPL